MKTYYQLNAYRTDSKTNWICHETKSLNDAIKTREKLLKAWSKYETIKIKIIKVTEEVVKL